MPTIVFHRKAAKIAKGRRAGLVLKSWVPFPRRLGLW